MFAQTGFVLEVQTIHLWWISLDVTDENLQTFISLLSESEKIKADRFKFPQHQRRYQAVHGILRMILGRYLNFDPTQLNFSHRDRGKPYLTNDCNPLNLQFNLSHSENMAIVGISRDRPLGVDLEKMRPMETAEKLAGRFFCASEYDLLTQAIPEERDKLFFQLWTAKEAYLKATGEGISGGLNQIEIAPNPLRFINLSNWYLQFFEFNPDDDHNYWAAIAFEGKGENIEVKCFRTYALSKNMMYALKQNGIKSHFFDGLKRQFKGFCYVFFSVCEFLKMPQMAQLRCFIIKLICQCVSPMLFLFVTIILHSDLS